MPRATVRKDRESVSLFKTGGQKPPASWSVLAAATLPLGVAVSNPLLGDDPAGTHAIFDYLAAPELSLIDILKQAQAANGALLVLDEGSKDVTSLLKTCGYTPFKIDGTDSLFAANYELPEAPWLKKSVADGDHRHAVVLPGGQVVLTEYDGAHKHAYYEMETAEKGDLTVAPGDPGHLVPDQTDPLNRVRRKKSFVADMADLVQANLIAGSANVIKAEGDATEEERFILGVVLEPDEVDSQGDTISAEEIRQAAHKYMEDYGNIGLQHQTFVNGKIKILESYILPVAAEIGGQAVKAGTWLMAFRILDESIWTAVKEGLLNGLSIGGLGTRVPVP